jgi:hypothetical protein
VAGRFEPDIAPDAPELAVAIEKTLRGDKDKDKKENDRASAAGIRLVAIYWNLQPAM